MKEIDPHLPVDKIAAFVVAKSFDQGVDFKCGNKITSMIPLPTKMWHGRPCDDLTGRKCGSFVVVGCSTFMPKNYRVQTNNTRWVVKCKCGRYQILTTKAVKKNHPQTACVECSRFKHTNRL